MNTIISLIFLFFLSVIFFINMIFSDGREILSFMSNGFNEGNARTINSIITSFTSLATALIALINLAVVVLIFRKNKKDDNEEKEKKKFSFWYQDIIIKNYIPKVETFYKEIDKLAKEILKDPAEKQELLLKISEQFTDFNLEFVELIKILNEDFASYLSNHLEGLEDYLHETLGANNVLGFSHTEIVDNKRMLIISLFNFDKHNYDFSNS
ncbi:hypothetical protein [Mesobacillus subterraneus]|uniref:hypothetical protein n=1 Tax=Mesobacillus subterraneus TaxID=285983 RepID=UPI00203DBEDA|nr:hypothetical protein [Mesobacillus subterraneus]MCM3683232.1 hypothetical protein [Mesobacillus subterraneus]